MATELYALSTLTVSAPIVVTDSFGRANNASSLGITDTGHPWEVLAGTWGISGGAAYLPLVTTHNLAVVETSNSDGVVSVTLAAIDYRQRLIVRATDASNYLFAQANEAGTVELFRCQAGSFTSLATAAAHTWAAGDVLAVVLQGSSIKVRVNGVQLLAATSTFNQSATKHGIGGTAAAQTNARWDNFNVASNAPAPVPNAITLLSPSDYQVYQRDATQHADIAITGQYTGTPTAIEARWKGGAWTTIDAAPAGGAYAGTLAGQSAGQGTLEVRFANATSVTDSAIYVGVGDVYIVAGQSNATGQGTNNQVYTHATLKAGLYNSAGAWKELSDPTHPANKGSVWPLLATSLMASQGVPVAFVATAVSGTGLTSLDPDWQPGHTSYDNAIAYIAASKLPKAKAVLWYQGERDAALNASEALYSASLSDLIDNLQADTGMAGMPIVVAQIGHNLAVSSPSRLDGVRQAQIHTSETDPDVLRGPLTYDVDLSDGGPPADGLHFRTDAEITLLADRWWRAIQDVIYGIGDGRAPYLASASQVDATHIDVVFTVAASPLVLGASPTIGWRVVDGAGTRTVTAVSLQSATTLRLTVDQALSGGIALSWAAGNDAVGSTIKDSGTTPLPPEPFIAEAVA